MAGVLRMIEDRLRGGPLHMTLLDPASKPADEVARLAAEAERLGTDALMVGGSTDITTENLDASVRAMKAATKLHVIHFPSSAGALSLAVDAIYFMSTLNSTDPRFIVGEQARGAPYLRRAGVEVIPMGYIIVAPGMTVGRVSKAALVPRTPDGADVAAGYAAAAQCFGMRLVYLEAGSGAPEPVPPGHVKAVKREVSIPVVVGGGITTPERARAALAAGADVLVTGTIAERGGFEPLAGILREVKARRR